VVSTAVTVVVLLVVFVPQVLLGVLTFPWWRLTAARRRRRMTPGKQDVQQSRP
jgi:Flp pilus assembly protein TadB